MPLISVLMPAFNASRFVAAAMDSLACQTLPDFEVIAIDDASSDDTLQLLRAYAERDSRIRVEQNPVNLGYLKTWNAAMTLARGEFITFLDADDVCHPARLEHLHRHLLSNPELGICGSSTYYLDERGRTTGVREKPTEWEEIKAGLLDETAFPFAGSAVMIHRRVYEEVGGYRDFFDRVGWEDHDWLIRCCERFRAANLPEAYYGYRIHGGSVTQHLGENAVRKLTIKKIGLALARQRAERGLDCLMTGNAEELQTIIDEYEAPYRADPSRVLRVMSSRAIQRSDWREAWSLAGRAVLLEPIRLRNTVHLLATLKGIAVTGGSGWGRASKRPNAALEGSTEEQGGAESNRD